MAVPALKYSIGNSASTTTSGAISNTDTSLPLTSDTNFAAKSGAGIVLIDEGLATEEIAYSTGGAGSALTIPLANRGLEGGSAQGHSSLASVKGVFTAAMWNDFIDSFLVGHNDAGTHKSGSVMTLPQINDTTADHQYIFAVSELTADRTITLPLLTGNDDFVFEDHTQTLTNKRVTKRTGTTTSSATPTINTDNVDFYSITAQTEAITSFTTNLSGTPTEGQTLWIAVTGTAARGITFGDSFEASTVALPTTTVNTARLDMGFVWNVVTSKWRIVALC